MKRKEGFSLIEVIVAVAILAVLSMPILLYFTNATIHSARGRSEQAADMAAQAIVEEIDSINNFDLLENALINTGRDWTLVGTPAPDVGGTTTLSRPIDVDGNGYVADVTINYGAYGAVVLNPSASPAPSTSPDPAASPGPSASSAPGVKAKYNSYLNPHFQELYSDQSVVISEKADTFDTGVNSIFYEMNGNAPGASPDPEHTERYSVSDIKSKVKKTYKLTAVAYPAGMYTGKGSCMFTFDKENDGTIDATSEVVLANTQVEKNKLKSMYFLFIPTYGDSEISGETVTQNVIVDFQTMIESDAVNRASDMEVSFIRQNTYSDTTNPDTPDTTKEFRLNLDTANSKNFLPAKYFSNDKVVLGNVSSGGLMNRTQDKRIASITVEIYNRDEMGNKEGAVLATNTTSKSV